MKVTKEYLKNLIYQVNGAAIEVHKHLGSDLLESVYHKCIKFELNGRKIDFKSELNVPVNYQSNDIETDLKCDLLIELDNISLLFSKFVTN